MKFADGTMSRAFLIIAVPLALVVIGYCLVFWQAGLTFPKGELLLLVALLFGSACWWMAKRPARKKRAGA